MIVNSSVFTRRWLVDLHMWSPAPSLCQKLKMQSKGLPSTLLILWLPVFTDFMNSTRHRPELLQHSRLSSQPHYALHSSANCKLRITLYTCTSVCSNYLFNARLTITQNKHAITFTCYMGFFGCCFIFLLCHCIILFEPFESLIFAIFVLWLTGNKNSWKTLVRWL